MGPVRLRHSPTPEPRRAMGVGSALARTRGPRHTLVARFARWTRGFQRSRDRHLPTPHDPSASLRSAPPPNCCAVPGRSRSNVQTRSLDFNRAKDDTPPLNRHAIQGRWLASEASETEGSSDLGRPRTSERQPGGTPSVHQTRREAPRAPIEDAPSGGPQVSGPPCDQRAEPCQGVGTPAVHQLRPILARPASTLRPFAPRSR